MTDTIAAVSTPRGKGGVALLRVSGEDALRKTGTGFPGQSLGAQYTDGFSMRRAR